MKYSKRSYEVQEAKSELGLYLCKLVSEFGLELNEVIYILQDLQSRYIGRTYSPFEIEIEDDTIFRHSFSNLMKGGKVDRPKITEPIHFDITPEERERLEKQMNEAFKKLAEQMKNKGGDLR
ncbi:hypothetical protein ACHHV8_11095 [Paenibacillus sp. TAB 01]|uniref:hypothetical protein n=1 Tax=Paenibacillus sp. TAB 01 TaxID=3368988 RepID=UPI0037524711